MPIPQTIIDQLLASNGEAVGPKRGTEIFAGTDYPRSWSGFIGQGEAVEQLQVQVRSARARGSRIEHTLLASGLHGVGKTTLAMLMAFEADVGLLQTTGPLSVAEGRRLIESMQDGDILFIDEIHLMGGKDKADWLLPFMTDGMLLTDRGALQMPDVTLLGATTDVGKLPLTLITRFMVQPTLYAYTDQEAAHIARSLSERMAIPIPPETAAPIAKAADGNPRAMRRILTAIRDLAHAYPNTHPNLDKALQWAGVSSDGLTMLSREMLVLLLQAKDHTASIDSLRAQLGEPGPLRHHEQQLLQRGLVTITGRGRQLTDAGVRRARTAVADHLASRR